MSLAVCLFWCSDLLSNGDIKKTETDNAGLKSVAAFYSDKESSRLVTKKKSVITQKIFTRKGQVFFFLDTYRDNIIKIKLFIIFRLQFDKSIKHCGNNCSLDNCTIEE